MCIISTWKTVSSAFMAVSKFDVGVWSEKLNEPPKSCIPSRAKMKMKRKRRKSRDMMEDKAFIRAITRLRRGDQYLKKSKEVRKRLKKRNIILTWSL